MRENPFVRIGNIEAFVASEDGHDVHAEAFAQVQFVQRSSYPVHLGGDVKIGQVQVFVQQAGSVFRFLLAQVFGPELPGTQVGKEGLLYAAGLILGEAAEHEEGHHSQRQKQQEQDGNVEQPGQHIENEAHGNQQAQHYTGGKRCPVGRAGFPQGTELFRLVLLDHNGPQERCQGYQNHYGGNHMRPGAGNPFFGQRKQQLEAQDADGNAKDAVNENNLPQGTQVFFPEAFLGGRRIGCFGIALQEGAHLSG